MREPATADEQAAVAADPAKTRRRLRLPRTFAALHNREYRLLWTGTLGSFMAMQMQMVARGYLAYALTGSAAILGVVSLSRGLPQLAFTLFGGVLADRVPKRNLLLVTQTCTGLVSLSTAVLVHSGLITIWQLVVLGFLEGAIFSFNMPARQSFLPELVQPNERMNAIALNTAGMNFTRIFGPALAGFLITVPFVGLTKVFYVMAACYLLPVAMLLRIRPRQSAEGGKKRPPVLVDLREGMRYIVRHETLGMLLVLGFVPLILGFSYQTLLPVFASERVLDVGASGLGLMSAVAGVGALIGALAVASFTNVRRRGLMQLGTGAMFGLSLALFALSPDFNLALVALAFVGFSSSVYQSLNSTLIMLKSDSAFFGRVMSVNQLGFSLTMIAPLPIGIMVDEIGAPATVATNGILITLFVVAVALLVGSYRRMESDGPAELAVPRAAGGV